jgi:hypothetical protein
MIYDCHDGSILFTMTRWTTGGIISLPILLSLLVVVFAVLVAITCATTSHHPQAQFRVQPLMLMDLVIY